MDSYVPNPSREREPAHLCERLGNRVIQSSPAGRGVPTPLGVSQRTSTLTATVLRLLRKLLLLLLLLDAFPIS